MNVVQFVADHALAEAGDLEMEATKLESDAKARRSRAYVLRQMHSIAAPHARDSHLDRSGSPNDNWPEPET